MSNRYNSRDIEVHLCNELAGTPLDGLDEDASNARARQVVEEALAAAYPQYGVHVYMDERSYGPDVVVGYPDELEPGDIMAVTHTALEDVDAWYVTAPDAL